MRDRSGRLTEELLLPTLVAPRLVLTGATSRDVDALWRHWTDPDVRRFLWDDETITRERAADTVADAAGVADRGLGLWTIAERAGSGILGCAALLPVSIVAESFPSLAGGIEPIVSLAPAVWGRGLGTEALQALLSYAFLQLQIPELAAAVDEPNRASRRLATRLGFEEIGEAAGPRYRLVGYRLRKELFTRSVQR